VGALFPKPSIVFNPDPGVIAIPNTPGDVLTVGANQSLSFQPAAGGGAITAVVAVTESRTAAAYVIDSYLDLTGIAAGTYAVSGYLFWQAGGVVAPSGYLLSTVTSNTGAWGFIATNGSATVTGKSGPFTSANSSVFTSSGQTSCSMSIFGRVIFDNDGSELALYWGPNASGGTIYLHNGSYLSLLKIA
jgi:hypothetical protein